MIKLAFGLVTTDFLKNEKYVLSLREDSIIFPSFDVDDYKNLNIKSKEIMIHHAFEDEQLAKGYANPKFIGINDEYISKIFEDSDKYLYLLYGCVCPKLSLKANFYWKTFDIYDINIREELGVINNVISTTI